MALNIICPITDDGKIKDDLGEFYHKPAANLAQQKKSEKIREKLQVHKEKRKIEQKSVSQYSIRVTIIYKVLYLMEYQPYSFVTKLKMY